MFAGADRRVWGPLGPLAPPPRFFAVLAYVCVRVFWGKVRVFDDVSVCEWYLSAA